MCKKWRTKKWILVVTSALAIVGAAYMYLNRTATWDEEVPLNTGETIWVSRKVSYSFRGASGNPMDIASRPDDEESISFSYKGVPYEYKGEAHLLVLAISKDGHPVLIAPASDRDWDWKHGYFCASPHYVQLVPDSSSKKWKWPAEIEPWTHGLVANLLLSRPDAIDGKRYSAGERDSLDMSARVGSSVYVFVNPEYRADSCKRREKP